MPLLPNTIPDVTSFNGLVNGICFAYYYFCTLKDLTLRGKLLIAVYLTSLFTVWNIDIPKRAFRHYEKGDLDKAREDLDKAVKKDTLNPAAYALYAQLFSDSTYTEYNVDSAYWAVTKSINQLKLISDPKDLEDLKEYKTDSISLEAQKDRIDALKFEEVKAIHTIDKYNVFINRHIDANQVPQAIDLRDHIAFEDAQRINLWQSYESFMEEYPEAKDYPLADSLHKKLLYEDLTADKTLDSYIDFLEEYPQSPYRDEIEVEIFNATTGVNTIESYVQFLNRYPSTALADKIANRVYHLYKEQYGSETFFEHFSIGSQMDSLANSASLEAGFWVPKVESGRYSLIDAKGEVKVITFFKELPQSYLCEPILTDFVYGRINGHSRIQGRNGRTIYEDEFTSAEDVGYGLVVIQKAEGQILIHKSGEVIIEEPQDEITVLSNSFIRTYDNGFYGLTTVNGVPYFENEFSQIDTLQSYLWLEKEEGIALVHPEQLHAILLGKDEPLAFEYTDIDLLPNGRIWAEKNGEEGILDLNFNEVIPFQKREIYDRAYGWKFQGPKGTEVWHDAFPELKGQLFDAVKDNDRWLAVSKDSSWILYNQLANVKPQQFDSLHLMGENMVMATRNDSTWAVFKNGKQVLMTKEWTPSLLVPQSYIKTGEQANYDFFMLSNFKNYRKIYNDNGKEILAATYKEVTALDPDMLRLQKTNAALVDSLGVFLLDFVYDGMGSNENGYVSILDAGKVGVINPAKRILIKPNYTKLIEPYTDTVLVAEKANFKGFINKQNKQLSGFDFDEVRYWNDTLAMVRIEDEWILHNIGLETAQYEGMLDYTLTKANDTEKVMLVTTENGQGIYSDVRGEIIEPTYDVIKVLGTEAESLYFAVKIVEEANIYVIIYFDGNGNKLFTQSLSQDEYFQIACPS